MKKINQYIISEPSAGMLNSDTVDLNNLPRISFCIPTLNNESTLDKCLYSIANQDYPDIEIIIVDGYSRDKTIDIAAKYTKNIYFSNERLGGARQESVERSSGQILALFDSDIIIPHERWLINAIKYFNYDTRVSTVWPRNIAPPKAKLIARLYFNMWSTIYNEAIKKEQGVFGGGNALFVKKYINEIGGINKSLHWGEDYDWAKKLKDNGYQVIYLRDPLFHDTMRSIGEFAKKQFVGARTFTETGFQLMGTSLSEVLYEQIILCTKGMVKGLLIERDISWILFPLVLFIRLIAYIYIYTKYIVLDKL